MRYLTGLFLALTLAGMAMAASGCSREDSQPAQQSEDRQAQSAEQADDGKPSNYLETVVIEAPRRAKKVVGTAPIQREINQYHALEGRYPASLDELAEYRDEELPDPPEGYRYHYDPDTGELQLVVHNS